MSLFRMLHLFCLCVIATYLIGCQTNPTLESSPTGEDIESAAFEGGVETERGTVIVLSESVTFKLESARLRPEAKTEIERIAEYLNLENNLRRTVSIEGHTDSTGEADYNAVLSKRRANTVKKAFTLLGVDESRLRTRGYGESQPIASNETREGRQKNRRVEIIIAE